MIKQKSFLHNSAFVSVVFFISLSLYCASENGYLPLVHGPYYFSIAKSLYHYNEINFYAVYPPIESLVYTLQIGISFVEYLTFFVSEKYWFLIFYLLTSLTWLLVFKEFIKFQNTNINITDKYILFFLFFFQPYNLNQIANFSNEAFYFPILIYFYFSFYRKSISNKLSNSYLIFLSAFIILGVYFRLHHVVVCINFFIFTLFLKDIKKILFILLIGILNLIIFYWIMHYTNLNSVFYDHVNYVEKSMGLLHFIQTFIYKFFLIMSYPILIEKFISNSILFYLVGIIFLIILIIGFVKNKSNSFNFYNLSYLILSILFVISLPPFEYSYILPFSFVIFYYCFVSFKNFFQKNYIKLFLCIIGFSFLTLVTVYFFVPTQNVEGFTYRKYIKDIKNNYIEDKDQPYLLTYAIDDIFDHVEDFYWQNDSKKPFCQISVKFDECKNIQEIDNVEIIKIIGKNYHNINTILKKKYKNPDIETFNKEEQIPEMIANKLNFSDYKLEKIYVSDYWYYYLYGIIKNEK